MKNNNDIGTFFIGVCIGVFIGAAIGYLNCKQEYNNKKPDIPTPVEKEVIDTLYITRDSLIYRTKYLEIIKHDTIEKIYHLNDSSSIDLFYKLVSE